MKVASWNVNSLRARLDRVLGWLDDRKPDVVCLQETKCTDDDFPRLELEARGWKSVTFGQRTYNGVAILARQAPTDPVRGFGDGERDDEARFICARVAGLRVASVYVPNGQVVGSEKYTWKMAFLARLGRWVATHVKPDDAFLLGGDFNVAPDERDVHDPAAWAGETLFHETSREALRGVLGAGLVDAFRLHNAEPGVYSWWDYRMLAFPKNLGLRIDHILVTPATAARCTKVTIDREARKGKLPSDHAPVIAEIA